MKFHKGFLLLVSIALSSSASAQGLRSFYGDEDFYGSLPFTTSLGVDFGWDSNPGASSTDDDDSAFIRGGADFAWGGGSRTTPIRVTGTIGGLYYTDAPKSLQQDFFWNSRIAVDVKHEVNRRLTVGMNSFLSYEVDPDYAIGYSLQSRTEQYLYGYTSLWASYQLSRRWNSVTRYNMAGIRYDENEFDNEDRFTQTVSQEFRYSLSRRVTLTGQYRFEHTNFAHSQRDSDSNYILGGADIHHSRRFTSHYRAGVQMRQDDYGDTTKPYGELAFRYKLAEKTSLHFANRLSLEESELAGYQDRYTWRSVLSLQHQITSRLRGSSSLVFLHNDFQEGVVGQKDNNENLFSGTLGLSYRMFSNVDLNAKYSFTTVDSDNPFREYDRHRVSLGMSTTF